MSSVQDSQAYKKIDMTIDLRSLNFEAREMDLSSHMSFSLVSEFCALAILERMCVLSTITK